MIYVIMFSVNQFINSRKIRR